MTDADSVSDLDPNLDFEFEAIVLHWRGPSPFFFAPLPSDQAARVAAAAPLASYGWGCIPVEAEIGGVVFTTSLIPRDGTYFLPLKAEVRRRAHITAADAIAVSMVLKPAR